MNKTFHFSVSLLNICFPSFLSQYEMSVDDSRMLPTVEELSTLVDFANGNKCSLLLEVL
jgi:hypothetical protein